MSEFISLSHHIRDALQPGRTGAFQRNAAMCRGASVFVGAGMSKNAEYSEAGENHGPPSWAELSGMLVHQLCPDDSEKKEKLLRDTGAVSGFLRLAQKFEARFGRPALNDLITEAVGPSRMRPGLLHKRLVRLPWIDIMTTNWDTLLEDAANQIFERKYDVVYSQDDLPITSRPRILKLHGSMPHNKPFIFTEEDFRSYPEKFAPFVNTVQQAMMETIFVLIGFSGEDPNFLSWTGWVRDRLKHTAPKIYLVDDFEGKADTIEVLRALNVVAVDLSQYPEVHPDWPALADQDFPEKRVQRLSAWIEFLHDVDAMPITSWPLRGMTRTATAANDTSVAHKLSELVAELREIPSQLPRLAGRARCDARLHQGEQHFVVP